MFIEGIELWLEKVREVQKKQLHYLCIKKKREVVASVMSLAAHNSPYL